MSPLSVSGREKSGCIEEKKDLGTLLLFTQLWPDSNFQTTLHPGIQRKLFFSFLSSCSKNVLASYYHLPAENKVLRLCAL